MSTAPKLKPCPFCGSERVRPPIEIGRRHCYAVCERCLAIGPDEQTKNAAAAAWNRRAAGDMKQETMK